MTNLWLLAGMLERIHLHKLSATVRASIALHLRMIVAVVVKSSTLTRRRTKQLVSRLLQLLRLGVLVQTVCDGAAT